MAGASIINNQLLLHPEEKYFTAFQKLNGHVQVKTVIPAINEYII
jgi:hypothetical protein